MFLNRLTVNEKKAFLQLAYHIANVDADFSEQEELIISKYCMEMQIDDIKFDQPSFDLQKCLAEFVSDASKKIALLEIMALIFADNILAEQEELVLKEMINRWGLNPNLAIVYREWAKSILSLYIQGEALIHI